MILVLKKGQEDEAEDYRGSTLTQTGYKVYAVVLAEIEGGGRSKGNFAIEDSGFRKGVGAIDQIYVLNYLFK